MNKELLRKLVSPVLYQMLSHYKGRYLSLRQGQDQPLLCNDFLSVLGEDKPHTAAFAAYYLGYCYQDLHGHFISHKKLEQHFSEEQLQAIRASEYAETPLYLRLSNMAVLPLQKDAEATTAALQKVIGSKGRNMLRKATKKGYRVQPIEYDEQLDDIFAINTSKSERQGRAMSEAYQRYPAKRSGPLRELGIEYHSFGCFHSDGHLVAYASFYRFGNVFRIDKVLGHGQHLTYGIMNLLFDQAAIQLSAEYPSHYLHYLNMNDLGVFKAHVGFRPYLVLLPLAIETAQIRQLVHTARHSRDWGGDWVERYLQKVL